jgi:hypothetical protein
VLACLAGLASPVGGQAWAGPSEQAEAAEAAYRTGDLVVAMGLFRQAAEAGHSLAQARLADLLNAAELNAEAVDWYRRSALQGDAEGEFGLGRLLANGEGVPRDAAQALRWYRQAAARQHVRAIEALARATRSGDLGLARDPAEADRLEQRAQALRNAAGVRP